MKTTVKNLEKQVIEFDLVEAYKELLIKAEGYDLKGWWFCPIFANIVNNELVLELGDPISKFPWPLTQNWVGHIDCWKFEGTAEDYKKYGLPSPESFDRNEIIKRLVSDYVDKFDFREIADNIKVYCKRKGFDVRFI